MTGSGFDWSGEERDSVVVTEQQAIAVYTNPRGHIVIRQEDPYGPEEDHWLVVAPHNVATLANALLRMVPAVEACTSPSPTRERKKGNGSASEPLLIPYHGETTTLPLGT